MKITNISCTQFAGVRDRNVSFTDGINVIYGKNESGKSTLVNLLSRTLFQNVRLDRRSDKEFLELYFPGAKKGSSIKGDFADGKISFETESGIYTLSKEWGSDSRCTLSTPDGDIREQGKIDEILRDVLSYGKGVYSDILFSSQRNTDVSLQTILDASKKSGTKKEITDAISQAFAETDGISVDAIERAITEEIDKIGKNWDFAHEVPVPKSKPGQREKSLGQVLKAYYNLEEAESVLKNILQLESELDRAAADYAEKDEAAGIAEEAYNKFSSDVSRLVIQAERKKRSGFVNAELSRASKALENWPKFAEKLEKATALQSEKKYRDTLDRYTSVKKIYEEIDARNKLIPPCQPTDTEIKQVKDALERISDLENKLCSMNIIATINMFSCNNVEITSVLTGEALDLINGVASITETVRIAVPGVMEMQLSPADVDVALVEEELAAKKKIVCDILGKHKAESLADLEQLKKNIDENDRKIEEAKNNSNYI